VKSTACFWIAAQLVPYLFLTQVTVSASPKDDPPPLRFVCNTGYTLEKCRADVAVLRKTLAKYPVAQFGNWTWILVRSEDWKAIVTPRGLDPDSPAFTYYAKSETFIEEALVAKVPGREDELIARWHMSVDRLRDLAIGHELGHSLCGEKEEAKANQVAKLLREGKPVSCELNPMAKLHPEKLNTGDDLPGLDSKAFLREQKGASGGRRETVFP
jgi:hypothetical protein